MDTPTAPAVMVTGHRVLAHPALVSTRLRDVLERLEPRLAISGGAEGADSLFARAALDVGVPLRLLLPNRHYRAHYPKAVPDEVVAAAAEVVFVVDRPDVVDWRRRWAAERWWTDNFARNAALVAQSELTVAVSARHPRVLCREPRGGTAACLRDLARARPGVRVLWAPDDPAAAMRWCPLR